MLTSADIQKFEDRKLDPEVAAKLGARFQNGKFSFDYTLDGALRFRKVRTLDKKFFMEPSGQKLQLWNLDALRGFPYRPSEPLVICEGEFDAIAVTQAVGGFVVSVPNGVAGKRSEGDIVIAEDTRFGYLWEGERLIPEVEQFNKIILCVDGDEPGMILRDELALRIGSSRCWYVKYPLGCKDANDVLRDYGARGVKELLDNAKPIRPGHLRKPSEIPPKAVSVTYSSGWGFLDKHLMFDRPELMVVTGIPNHGKGQFIRCLSFNLARAHGWKTAFLAQEDTSDRIKRDMRRFALNQTPYANRQQQEAAFDWMDQHFRISEMPEDEAVTIEMVETEMESAALHHDCQVFVLDPWNEVEHKLQKGEIQTDYIERTLRRLLRKIRRLNLVMIIAAHPTKLDGDEKPDLYKIAGSANWKNKCQHGVIIHKPSEGSNGVELTVEKSKDWETMGQPGTVWMEFNREQCQYVLSE